VELQGQDSAPAPHGLVLVGHLDHDAVVDLVDEVVAAGDDVEFVPFALANGRLERIVVTDFLNDLRLVVIANDRLLAALRQDAAIPLAVQDAGVLVGRVDIRLVAAHNPACPFRLLEAAVLDAAVAAEDAEPDFQFEIIEFALAPDEEGVFLERRVGNRLAGDRSILDAPKLRVAVPAGQRLAVKDAHEPRVLVLSGGSSPDRNKCDSANQAGQQYVLWHHDCSSMWTKGRPHRGCPLPSSLPSGVCSR